MCFGTGNVYLDNACVCFAGTQDKADWQIRLCWKSKLLLSFTVFGQSYLTLSLGQHL